MPEPIINDKIINLYQYNLNEVFHMTSIKSQRIEWLKRELSKYINNKLTIDDLFLLCTKLYERAYSGLDVMKLMENPKFLENYMTTEKRYELLVCFNRVRMEFRNEKLLLLFILNFVFLSSELSLENISFM